MKELIVEEANDDLVTKVETDGFSEGKTSCNGSILIRIKTNLTWILGYRQQLHEPLKNSIRVVHNILDSIYSYQTYILKVKGNMK